MIGFKKTAIISFVAAAFIVGNTAQAGLHYNITDLGTLGGGSYGFGINASGQVTGYSVVPGTHHAFITSPRSLSDFKRLLA
jgi:probable HAF family extracellular repeat protein